MLGYKKLAGETEGFRKENIKSKALRMSRIRANPGHSASPLETKWIARYF